MGREARATKARRDAGELVAKVTITDGQTRVEYLPDDPATAARVLLGGLNALLTKLEPKPKAAEAPKGAGNGSGPTIAKPSPADRIRVDRTRIRGS